MGHLEILDYSQQRISCLKSLLLLVLLFPVVVLFGQKKQVCFSYDDLPLVSYGMNDSAFQMQLTNKLIGALNKNNIPAIGFVNERKLYYNDTLIPVQVEILKSWINNGLELGNHTFSHPDYNEVSCASYTQDIIKDETVIKSLLATKGKELTYFRHPFLHVGNTKEKADSLDTFLKIHGYQVAPVTIDNEDYLFASAYKQSKVKNDTSLMKQIGHDFVNYIEQKIMYYEKQSQALFGRNINQILLLHASLLNADYTDSLAQVFKKHNYEFVSMGQTLTDPAYQTNVTFFGDWGISWIDRWALSQGKKGAFF
jgi:peptidoglycan/xylan/chitin deacetylase (PgdA/CDA1 family)